MTRFYNIFSGTPKRRTKQALINHRGNERCSDLEKVNLEYLIISYLYFEIFANHYQLNRKIKI